MIMSSSSIFRLSHMDHAIVPHHSCNLGPVWNFFLRKKVLSKGPCPRDPKAFEDSREAPESGKQRHI